MSVPGTVQTGRGDSRRLCESCKARIKVGELRDSEVWTARLLLTPEQIDLILLAAAEFDRLSEKAGESTTAVEFTDWLKPDALHAGPYRTSVRVPSTPPRRKVAA